MSNAPTTAWPELLRPATAAAMLDLSESTWRAVYPILAARYGLKIIGLAGPKFHRADVLAVVDRLADAGLDISIDKAARKVRIGSEDFTITTSSTGKSGRGRPPGRQTVTPGKAETQ